MSAEASRDGDFDSLRPLGAPSAKKRTFVDASVLALLTSVARHATAATTASAIADELVELLGARSAAVYFADAGERILTLAGSRSMREAPSPLCIHDGAREPAAVAARIRRFMVAAKRERGDDTIVAVPLVSGQRLLGVVHFELAMDLDTAAFAALSSLGVVLSAIVDRARRADEARASSEWRSLVAHELRQPLSAMSLQVQLVLAGVGESLVANKLHRMGRTIARLNRLLGDLSDAALVDIRKVPLHRAPTDLVELATSFAHRGEGAASRSVEVVVRGAIPRLSLDGERFEQVFENLLTNAEKYGLAGAPIQVVLERRKDDVLISVTNQGRDIPVARQARLFDRFYRADDGGKIDGLGVGLYVCRGLVEAHGGAMSVRSGGGSTTFSVVLPLPKGSPSVASCGRAERAQLSAE